MERRRERKAFHNLSDVSSGTSFILQKGLLTLYFYESGLKTGFLILLHPPPVLPPVLVWLIHLWVP